MAETSSAPRPHVRDTLSRVVELLADDRPLPASYAEDEVWEDAADTPGFPFVHSIARSGIGRCGPATVSHDGGLRKRSCDPTPFEEYATCTGRCES